VTARRESRARAPQGQCVRYAVFTERTPRSFRRRLRRCDDRVSRAQSGLSWLPSKLSVGQGEGGILGRRLRRHPSAMGYLDATNYVPIEDVVPVMAPRHDRDTSECRDEDREHLPLH
jgi:hypothetical protein